MAPGAIHKIHSPDGSCAYGAESDLKKKTIKAEFLVAGFAHYRKLVSLLSQPDLGFLNASHAPPSNLNVHEAIKAFSHQALRCPRTKPQWQAIAEKLRRLVARYINTDPFNVAFTRDTTEGLGDLIKSVPLRPGDNVVVLGTEHPNHAYGWMALRSLGIEVRQVPSIAEADRVGRVFPATAEMFAPFVDDRTRAIGFSSIMFHSGQKNDVAGISTDFRPRGVHVLVDATQQVGSSVIDVQALGVSASTFSLHKGLNTPVGLGCLYIDPAVIAELDPVPSIVGFGAEQNIRSDYSLVPEHDIVYHPNARSFDHGNMNFLAAAAGKAFLKSYLESLGVSELENYLYSLGDQLRKGHAGLNISIVGSVYRKGHAPHLYILELLDPAWAIFLRDRDVYTASYRLGVRVSLSFYNNANDINCLASVLEEGISEGLLLA